MFKNIFKIYAILLYDVDMELDFVHAPTKANCRYA